MLKDGIFKFVWKDWKEQNPISSQIICILGFPNISEIQHSWFCQYYQERSYNQNIHNWVTQPCIYYPFSHNSRCHGLRFKKTWFCSQTRLTTWMFFKKYSFNTHTKRHSLHFTILEINPTNIYWWSTSMFSIGLSTTLDCMVLSALRTNCKHW